MSPIRRGSLGSRMLEGSLIALDSVRANKVRAALTILGVAIGVTSSATFAGAWPPRICASL